MLIGSVFEVLAQSASSSVDILHLALEDGGEEERLGKVNVLGGGEDVGVGGVAVFGRGREGGCWH